MCAHVWQKRRVHAFTLVEMLVVIVIIGILAGLLTGAVIMARTSARIGMVRAEIAQLEMALQMYKNQYGEYPPDFAFLDIPPDEAASNPTLKALRTQARQRVINHIRKRWPRAVLPLNNPSAPPTVDNMWLGFVKLLSYEYPSLRFTNSPVGNLDVVIDEAEVNQIHFSPASALPFWLGGLPEQDNGVWKPQGFHADPRNPFQKGSPREKPLFEFRPDQLLFAQVGSPDVSAPEAQVPLMYKPNIGNIPTGPFVYFRAVRVGGSSSGQYAEGGAPKRFPYFEQPPSRNRWPWWERILSDFGQAVPYMVEEPKNSGRFAWRNADSFQIVAPGLDGAFGRPGEVGRFQRVTRTGQGFSEEDYDNIANFCQRTLEDEIE